MTQIKSKEFFGSLAVLCSAFFFYLSTVVIRWAKTEVQLDPIFFVFYRFLLGFIVIAIILVIKRKAITPCRYDLLLGRCVMNMLAVICFFKAVHETTVAEANILNMTYPIFIAIFSWTFLKEQRSLGESLMAGLAFCGIFLVMSPEDMSWQMDNFWGLASGILAAIALIFLNKVRRYNDSETILFFMFGLGTIAIYIIFHDKFYFPGRLEHFYLFLCAIFAIAGQYLITIGFRYVTAVEGGILSSGRILMAAILGPYLAFDPPLSYHGWLGAIIILSVNVYLTWKPRG